MAFFFKIAAFTQPVLKVHLGYNIYEYSIPFQVNSISLYEYFTLFFICLSVAGYLGCICSLATMNNAIMKIHIQGFICVYEIMGSFSWL